VRENELSGSQLDETKERERSGYRFETYFKCSPPEGVALITELSSSQFKGNGSITKNTDVPGRFKDEIVLARGIQ
jgi:hypothetical protein